MPKNYSMEVESGKHSLNMSGGIQADIKYAFSAIHISAANMFAKTCFEIEKDFNKSDYFSQSDAIRSYVTGSIVLSVAALEAYINEQFLRVRDNALLIEGGEFPEYITKGNEEGYKKKWRDFEHKSPITKYDKFLEFAHAPSMKNSKLYKNAKDLYLFRNRFVHYKPEWYSEKKEAEIEKRYENLEGQIRFSPYFSEQAPYFPRKCFTYDFAQWAVNVALDFMMLFDFILGIDNNYDQYKLSLE